MTGGFWYCFIYCILRFVLFFYHPVLHVKGRENIPPDGSYVICPNHSGLMDPVWVIIAMRIGHIPRIMAKKELMEKPVLGWILAHIGVIGVDRGNADIHAIKEGLRCLKNGQQLLIFPEGTRKKPGKTVTAKRGAVTLAQRTDVPILPVYLTEKRRPFGPMTCVFGEPYHLDFGGQKPTDEQLEAATQELMEKIYRMGEQI